MKASPPKLLDVCDGKSIPAYWKPNNLMKRGESALMTRIRKDSAIFPEWTHNCWLGEYSGYGRRENGTPLFRTLRSALKFAQSAYNAGYRMKGKQ